MLGHSFLPQQSSERRVTRPTDRPQSPPRREFLQTTGLGLLGALSLPAARFAFSTAPPAPDRVPKLAVQLYTVRDQLKADFPGTLHRLAALGYDTVETAFLPDGVTLAQAAQYLRDAGLGVCASHVDMPEGAHRDTLLTTAAAYGCTRMIWHGWPEDKLYSTLAGTRALIARYNAAHLFAKSNGLQFGLHNHWWEYRNKVGGRFVFEVLHDELDPDIFFEVDTYWVKVADHDPAQILRTLGPRARLIHMKDGPALWNDQLAVDNPDPMTAVGKGTQDVPAIARAARGNIEYMVVEMDKTATDVFSALAESYSYLDEHGYAVGRRSVR